VSKGKLTRQELGWLLTQEAQGAAERLRLGVSALTQAPPPPTAPGEGDTRISVDASGVDATLSALDDAMKMLSNLHAGPTTVRGRRGRIDLASLLWEVAPDARVSIEPGSGTEVFGDEAELRRMLHVILGHGSGSGSAVTMKRNGEEVVLAVALGPDSSPTADTERAWLSRMAIRYGGRYEIEGGTEVLGLPAEGAEARQDVVQLQKELDEARKQGQAYARELAGLWAAGDEVVASSSYPPPAIPATDRQAAIAQLAGGVAATLRARLAPVGRDVAELRAALSPRKSSPDFDMTGRLDLDQRLEGIRHKLIAVQDFVAELAAIGEVDPLEPVRSVDLAEVVRAQIRALEPRAARGDVTIRVRVLPEGSPAPLGRVALRAGSALVRAVLSHAIDASPRGSTVGVAVCAPEEGTGARIVVDDAGTALPAAARRALRALEFDPATFGRPSGIAPFVAAELAAAQGAWFDLGDAPASAGGGVRTTVTFLR
jgi:two-component system, OmpR family, sensor kinase